MLLSGFCQVAVCNLKPLDADSGASVRAGLSEVPWSQLATSSTAIRMHLFQPASQSGSQPSSKPSSRQQPQSVRQQQEAGRQVTHASTSISCGRAAGEICLFGYANHNADRLTQQITQFHCACHTYTYTHSYIHTYISVSWSAGNMRCDAMRCEAKRRRQAVINNQLDDEHNKNENRNRCQTTPSVPPSAPPFELSPIACT